MSAIPTFRQLRPNLIGTQCDVVCFFLAPSIQHAPVARFSTSPALWKKDNNKNRGVSALRHTGLRPRQTLSVKTRYVAGVKAKGKLEDIIPIPRNPNKESKKEDEGNDDSSNKVKGDADHGLWDFFPKNRSLLVTPVEESQHGRAWTVDELRKIQWNDLHSLWWVCAKERNRLATEKIERNRLEAGFGDYENRKRDETVQETMKAILDTLAERQKAWEEAYALAEKDPTVDLKRSDGPQYVMPEPYSEDAHEFDGETQLEDIAYDKAHNTVYNEHTEKQEGTQEGTQEAKELPKAAFFNTQENPLTVKDKIKEKTTKNL